MFYKFRGLSKIAFFVVCMIAVVGSARAQSDARIAYTYSNDSGGSFSIRARNVDGSGEIVLADVGTNREASFSSDGSKIAFTSNRGGGAFNIWIANGDGSNPVQVTNFAQNAVQPNLSGNGQKIAFVSQGDIWVMNADGSNAQNITQTPVSEEQPSLSGDGSKVAFRRDENGNVDIYAGNSDGTQMQRLTSHASVDEEPSLNYDASRIVFQSHRDGNVNIWAINADGSGLIRLTDSPKREEQPVWSPDATRIAYSADEGSINNEIYVMNADGSGQTRLTNTSQYEAQPTWGGGLPVGLSVNDAKIEEGNSGTRDLVFMVSLSLARIQTVTVNFATSNSSAQEGSDYESTSGQLTFAPGQVTQTVRVPIFGDTDLEANETFFLDLSGAMNVTIDKTRGVGTIESDDKEAGSLVVTSLGDVSAHDGQTTLREAVAFAATQPSIDTISFSPVAFPLPAPQGGYKILLTQGELLIDSRLTIEGLGASTCTIARSDVAGTPRFRVLRVTGFDVFLNHLTISGGDTSSFGGGLLNEGIVTLNNCTISGNVAGSGGGISNYANSSVRLQLKGCTVSHNRADYGGGLSNFGLVRVEDSSIFGNRANSAGGGVDNSYSQADLALVRCAIYDNYAPFSAGVQNYAGRVFVLSCTISGNVATNESGGIANVGYSDNAGIQTALMTLTDCTVVNNRAPRASGIHNSHHVGQAVLHMRNSIVALNSGGDNLLNNGSADTAVFNFIGGDPRLGPLQDNGGPTWTHAPLDGSPVIDAGQTLIYAIDQRSVARPYDSPALPNAAGGNGADIGAVELLLPWVDLNAETSGVDYAINFFEGMPSFPIASSNVQVKSGQNSDIVSATVTLLNRPDGAAEGLDVVAGSSGLTVSAYDGFTGVITISGVAPEFVYARILRSVTYRNSSENPTLTPRIIRVTVNDGMATASAQTTVTIVADNDLPLAVADDYAVNEDTVLSVPASNGVLANDSDAENTSLTCTLQQRPAFGTLQLEPNGAFTYTPSPNFSGTVFFLYQVNDGDAGVGNGTATITVRPVNDAPIASNRTFTVAAPRWNDSTGVLGYSSDPDGDTNLRPILVSRPTHGTLDFRADGTYLYAPNIGFYGRDFFTYRVQDAALQSNIGRISFEVLPDVSSPPFFRLQLQKTSVVEGSEVEATLTISPPPANRTNVSVFVIRKGIVIVPATVQVLAGQRITRFRIRDLSDELASGSRSVTIFANVAGHHQSAATLTVFDAQSPALRLTVAPIAVRESDGPAAAMATLSRNTPLTAPLNVQVSSSSSKVRLQSTVYIPFGVKSVTFPLDVVDDYRLDGAQIVTIHARATRFISGQATLRVDDNGLVTRALQLSLENNGIHIERVNGQNATGTVTLPGAPLARDLIIDLLSNDIRRLAVPRSVVLRAGQNRVSFPYRVFDNVQYDGTHSIRVRARALGFASSLVQAIILDNDGPVLTLSLSRLSVSENAGSLLATISRSNGPFTQSLSVNLASSDRTRATVPASVTVPAGRTSATFTVNIVNNRVVDGTRRVLLGASSFGFSTGTASLEVLDDDTTPASPVALSGVTGNGDRIQLRFTGALNANVALNVENYRVLVNGATQEIESVSYAAPGLVTLYLNQITLKSGDAVRIETQNLRDTLNRTLSASVNEFSVR